jgi:hypothetical protein
MRDGDEVGDLGAQMDGVKAFGMQVVKIRPLGLFRLAGAGTGGRAVRESDRSGPNFLGRARAAQARMS